MKMTCLKDVLPRTDAAGRPILAALLNNMVVPLETPILGEPDVRPLTRADSAGFYVHRNTAVFLLAKCAAELYPKAVFRVRYSIGPALWCTLDGAGEPLRQAVVRLRERLTALVDADEPISVSYTPYGEAIDSFTREGRGDELNLLKHSNAPAVSLSRCAGFQALSQSALAPSTGCVRELELTAYDGGLVINVPSTDHPDEITPLTRTDPYIAVFRRQRERTAITGVETVGDLNQCILEGGFDTLVRTVEAIHTKELAAIADRIAARRPAIRLVLLAGPSSAGKTTTAHRLSTQLRVNGLKPLLLSTDDYFVGDARNPIGPDGKPDYETVEAVDTERLAADLSALFEGRAVHLRKFDFLKHDGYDAEKESRLAEGGVVVLEGIHALNPCLTAALDDSLKFKVYLNAMTQLVVDSCNRIPTSDTRLLRRLIRDFRTRGASPLRTFDLWPNVLAGERKWIYPYQGEADAVFNSALDYELAVLRPYANELLNQVKPWDAAYLHAHRLLTLLQNVSIARADAVPGDSILRETIGGSQLDY